MARVIYHLDKRPTRDGRHHIKLSVSHNKTTALIPTDVFVKPEHWFAGNAEIEPHIKKTCPGAKTMNDIITERLEAVQERVNELILNGTLNSFNTATQVKNHILAQIEGKPDNRGTVAEHFKSFIERRNTSGTAGVYRETLMKIAKYNNLDTLRFEDITVAWLKDFENRLRKDGLAVNTVARHLRDIRAVYNDAIDYNIVSLAAYPFRRFKITHEKTAKRALTLEQLRLFRDYPCEPAQEQYRDIFMLVFLLCGINIIDLCNLTEIRDGYIEYRRAKTGRLYKIKVEPEAMEIIERYRGKKYLLNILDRYQDYANYRKRLNMNLRSIGTAEIVKDKVGKLRKIKRTSLFPELSSYWARHSWATLAAELDIPKETIAKALGHSENSTTDIYIRFDQKKIDEANRRVIDYVNGKEDEPRGQSSPTT